MNIDKLKQLAPLAALVVAVAGFGGYQYLYGSSAGPSKQKSVSVVADTSSEAVSAGLPATKPVNLEEPPLPQGETITRGIVEVGASGFNAFVANFDKQGRWELEPQPVGKQFDKSLAAEGLTSDTIIQEKLTDYLSKMASSSAGKNLHFVISSGALQNPKLQQIATKLAARGFFVNKVTAQQEGVFAYKAAMNPAYEADSFVVDVGSVNTKIAWKEGGQIKTFELPGSKYFQDKSKTDELVASQVAAVIKQIPANKRARAFVIGGAAWSIASAGGAPTTRYTELPDMGPFIQTPDKKLHSGAIILGTIRDGSGAQLVFDQDANFAIGLLSTLK